jgi:hydrogenase maturation protease
MPKMKSSKWSPMSEILLIGIGNISRGDDGIGWLFADEIESIFGKTITVQKEFQLVVEDALKITEYDTVIFVDASENKLENGFEFRKVEVPDVIKTEFTSHAQTPENIVFLAADLFHIKNNAYLMEISGRDWELGEGLSDYGRQNLNNAMMFFRRWLVGNLNLQLSEISESA